MMAKRKTNEVDEYIAGCPKEAQGQRPVPLNAPIISKFPDILIRALITMGCLFGSASRSRTYAYIYAHR
jgi:hypothetical protein